MSLALLRQRNFGLLWWAGLISLAGNWAIGIALPISVLRLTGSPAAVSAVVAAALAGTLIFASFAGAFVDRWDRRRVVVLVNVLQALVLLPLLLVDSPGDVWIAVLVAFVEAALKQFFEPAENALMPHLVAADKLPAANALNSLNNDIGRLVGPAVGGIAATTLGLGGTALLDAATFAISAGMCALIAGTYRADRSGEPRRHLIRELAEGLLAAGRNRILRAIFALIAISSVGEGMMSTLFAVFVTRALHGGGREMGWLMSAQAVGGIVGSLVGTRIVGRFRPVALVTAGFTFFGFVDIIIFNYPRFSTELWPVIVLFFIVGLPVGIHLPAIMTLFQVQTPDRLRGRVFAALGMGGSLAGMLGAGIAGALGQSVSAVDLLTVQGAGCVVAGVLFRVLAGRGPVTLTEPEPGVVATPAVPTAPLGEVPLPADADAR